jgi:hypothetical protein
MISPEILELLQQAADSKDSEQWALQAQKLLDTLNHNDTINHNNTIFPKDKSKRHSMISLTMHKYKTTQKLAKQNKTTHDGFINVHHESSALLDQLSTKDFEIETLKNEIYDLKLPKIIQGFASLIT